MNYTNHEDETFDELPDLIVGSNFNRCIFNAGSRFERCTLHKCELKNPCYFDRTNVMICTGDGLENSVFDKSYKRDIEDPVESEVAV